MFWKLANGVIEELHDERHSIAVPQRIGAIHWRGDEDLSLCALLGEVDTLLHEGLDDRLDPNCHRLGPAGGRQHVGDASDDAGINLGRERPEG